MDIVDELEEDAVPAKDWNALLARIAELDPKWKAYTDNEEPDPKDPLFQEEYDPWEGLRQIRAALEATRAEAHARVVRTAVEETEAEEAEGAEVTQAKEESYLRRGLMTGRLYWAHQDRRKAVKSLKENDGN